MEMNLDKASLDEILEDAVEKAIGSLAKGDPDHDAPGLNDDFAESDAVAASEGAAVKAEEDDDDEDEDKDKKPAFLDKKADTEKADTEKSNAVSPTLVKSMAKGIIGMTEAISTLTEKVNTISKGRARGIKSATKEENVEYIEKGGAGDTAADDIIKANSHRVGQSLLKMHTEGKIPGRTLTEFELFGVEKLSDGLKKAVMTECDLVK